MPFLCVEGLLLPTRGCPFWMEEVSSWFYVSCEVGFMGSLGYGLMGSFCSFVKYFHAIWEWLGVLYLTEFRTQLARWIIYPLTEFTEEQRPFSEQGEHAEKSGPSPVPSPEGKGRDYRDTPMERMRASYCAILASSNSWKGLCYRLT